MRNDSSTWRWLLLVMPLVASCTAYAPPDVAAGMSRQELIARMGPPERERQIEGGSRLEFPRGPFGTHTWFVDLDTGARATRVEQVLTEANFNRVIPGMPQDDVRALLGRPGDVQMLGRARGLVWSYRFESPLCVWFQVEFSRQQQVRSAGYGQPPECEGREDRSVL